MNLHNIQLQSRRGQMERTAMRLAVNYNLSFCPKPKGEIGFIFIRLFCFDLFFFFLLSHITHFYHTCLTLNKQSLQAP